MYELIPLLAGCVTGVLASRLRSQRLAVAVIVVVALAAGTLAASISGELHISAGFLLWDVGQGVVIGLAAFVLARRWTSAREASSSAQP
jgi:cyanate permease